MKNTALLFLACIFLGACTQKQSSENTSPITGTWRLVSALTITEGDTVKNYPVPNQEMIKMLNDTHFAFLRHDLSKGKGENPAYTAGGGTYTYKDGKYTEHLAYLNHRDWEGRDFNFDVTFNGDTLVQKGLEKIDSLNVNHEIVETYVRVKQIH